MDQQKEIDKKREMRRRFNRKHPVKQTKDGTKYRVFVDLLWFTLRITCKDGQVFEGVAGSDHQGDPNVTPFIELRYIDEQMEVTGIKTIKEPDIESIEVLARPEGDIGPFGPLPGNDDPCWDDEE